LELLLPEVSALRCQELVERIAGGLGPRATVVSACYPNDGEDAEVLMEVALERLVSRGEPPPPSDEPLFLDPVMVRLAELMDRLCAADLPVLLQGEPGVGKEMLAGLLHARGLRMSGPFLKLDPSGQGLDGSLAGTSGGTLFVSELLRLTPLAQERLSRMLARDAGVPDLRIIAATSARDLNAEAQRGALRHDLALTLSQVVLPVPALRDRPSEILPLAESFLAYFRARLGRSQVLLGGEARRVLSGYSWPGNLRELRNAMARAALAADGDEVRGDALPPAARDDRVTVGVRVAGVDLRTSLKETEREVLLKALAKTRWNVTEAAKQLGLPRRTVVYRMSRLGLRRPPR
ncbi:MAG TPA: sigma 54-interacting transcriptional regulator, partial [Myxococcaceae bacterium]|nr:sigma 54-interacting transcriptional regulator [Myxococcaceae bacterium]